MIELKTLLDFSGSAFSLAATIGFVLANRIAWPLSIAAIIINVILYFSAGLYSDSALEGFYFILTIYGWHAWSNQHNKPILPVTHLKLPLACMLIVFGIIGVWLDITLLQTYTHSTVPVSDAITTVLSLIAQFLICRKIIETWILWFIVDGSYLGLYLYKGIPFHSTLMLIYLGLAVAGYIRWWRLKPSHEALNNNPRVSAQQSQPQAANHSAK